MATWTSSTARSTAPSGLASPRRARTSSQASAATLPTSSARSAPRSTPPAPTPDTSSPTRPSRRPLPPGGPHESLIQSRSGLLGGTPDINFAPAAIRTDNAVKATIAKAIGAGDFVGIGIGVYLAIAGFAVAAIGAILARPATDERTWRTQDYVLLAVLAVVFGAIYWAWLGPYLGIETILAGVSAQLGQELLFGLWFVSGLLGGYIIRRPGAAFLSETLAAFAEVLLGAPAGPVLIVTGFMQALGPELTFAATGYRRWGWGTMLAAGVAAGVVALPWNWLRLGYFALDPGVMAGLFITRVIAGGLAGLGAKAIGDLVAATGSLNYFALGRERVREV